MSDSNDEQDDLQMSPQDLEEYLAAVQLAREVADEFHIRNYRPDGWKG